MKAGDRTQTLISIICYLGAASRSAINVAAHLVDSKAFETELYFDRVVSDQIRYDLEIMLANGTIEDRDGLMHMVFAARDASTVIDEERIALACAAVADAGCSGICGALYFMADERARGYDFDPYRAVSRLGAAHAAQVASGYLALVRRGLTGASAEWVRGVSDYLNGKHCASTNREYSAGYKAAIEADAIIRGHS